MQEVLKLIQERQSGRMRFDAERPVAKQDLRQILEAGRWAPTAHNMQNFDILVVDDPALLDAIGNINAPISETFIKENYQQLSFSEEELLRKKVGLLGTMFPAFMRTPGVQPDASTAEQIGSFQGRMIQTSPVLLIVVYDPRKRAPASEGDFWGIISLGCVMENMWLMAHALGLSCHILSVLSADPVAQEVKRLLNIPEDLKIAFALRLGYPIAPPTKYLRVRREVEDFTHYNRFGNKSIGC
jgi:nitroreductase